ncbi:diacylglycerol lipase-beta-like isoform X1 [Mya arenaria]|uniref:diacylglycerol lipase-beta-like isoform X1 n=1 Tax=Mya arenaria TaxID=6604 RepID=UPI0022E24188|nr:diacylglycerol lipase-beta-like isoform X1 [Mya arenaria]
MPQLQAFRRKWAIGSDDFVYPGLGEIFLRIIWLVVVSVIFHLHKDAFNCKGGDLLHAYFVGLLTLLVVSILMASVVVYLSMQGTITNQWPRRKITIPLYIKVAICLPELAWNIMGTYWSFGISSGCEVPVVLTVKAVVLTGWVIGIIVLVGLGIVFDPLGAIHGSSTASKEQAQRLWQTRCKILCCCVGCDEKSIAAFNGIAEIVSNFFEGVDLVPTDIACGLILVHRIQKNEQHRLKSVVVQTRDLQRPDTHTNSIPSSSSYPAPKHWMTVPLMCHYMKFAMASYGWPLYVFTHLLTGACRLWPQCRCCTCTKSHGDVTNDNCCLCNTASIHKTTGTYPDDIVYASFHNKIYEIPFFVSIDRKHNAVVVAVRGTLSLKDVITDLTAECDSLDIEDLEDCKAHRGILQAAKYVQETLDKHRILENAFDIAQEGAQLVITGHSLGAGSASLLAILLKPKYPDLICFAFSPSGGLMSLHASEYCRDFVCSVVLGRDIIPRLGIHTMERLKAQLLRAVQASDMPKYQLLASGVWQMFCGLGEPSPPPSEETEVHTPLISDTHPTPSYARHQPDLQPKPIGVAAGIAERQREQRLLTHTWMYPPGHILQIIEASEKVSCCGEPDYEAVWSQPEEYKEVLVSPKMLSDHMPDAVMKALDQLMDRGILPTTQPIDGQIIV